MSLFCCLLLMMVCLPMGGDCFKSDLCDSGCADIPSSDLSYQRGMKFTYRFSTTVTTTLQGSNAGRAGLALDCVVDIDVVSKCHLVMQIRNPQIKRLSPLKEHSVQHLKKLRESLEKTRLRFSLQGGKVTALCLQEGEQVWTLNIKRGFLSMIQTSHTSAKQETELETDVYGTCASRYERRGALLLKSRDIKQCQLSRLDHFWPHSVAFTDDSSVQSELLCSQRVGSAVTEEVNCTETVSLVMPSKSSGLLKTQTVSTIKLLRVQPILPSTAESGGFTGLSHLQFEDEGTPQPSKMISHQQAAETARMLCVAATEPQQVSHHFLQLVFQLRDLTLPQLKLLWQEAAFKCRNDWQPLLDALPACGSENCIILLMELLKKKELDESEAKTLLDSIALIPHPSPRMIHLISSLVAVPEFFPTALLSGSSMVHQLCQRSETPCVDLPQVQNLVKTIQDILKSGCDTQEPTRLKELTYAVKSVGNIGGPAESLIPLLNRCVLGNVAPLELRLSSLKAFRRFSCSSDRSVLLQLYGSSQEDPEVRIAAYQQLMRCPNPHVYKAVRTILRDETSSQVGSFVWSHLTNILRSEDPMKRTLTESLPDDIISKDFEAEFMKHSSYSDHTLSSGLGMANIESSVIFSPKSFIPRSASANLTVYFQGRATNLLEVDLRVENAEPLLKSIFGHNSQDGEMSQSKKQEPSRAVMAVQKINEDHACLSSTNRYLNQARTMVSGQDKLKENQLRCSIGVKVFGNELGVFTCEDIYNQINQLSLSTAGLAVKLLKGQEVQLNHRAVLMTDRLVLPSLSGLPIKFAINMTSLLSLHVKGNANYRDTSHFSVTGYIKPSAYLGLSARMGVDGALGQAAVEWMSNLKSSMSLDGSVDLQEGQDIRVTLNTPEDVMDIISFNSQVFQLSGDHREEISGPKTRIQKTSCTPKSLSKIVGWQLCSNASYPLAPAGISLPPSGPVHLSLRLLKLDRGLHYYLLEAAYSLQLQRGSWLPKEASVHFFLATPQSSIPRDMSFDVAFNSQRLLLRVTHPLKTILIQGQVEHEKSFKRAKVEFVIDTFHYYIMALIDSHTVASEQRTRYHLEAKTGSDGSPVILSANVTRGIGGKTSFSATVKNVFRETALVSVSLERRRDSSSKQYSLEAELLFPGVIGSRMLGLMEHKGSLWSSALRLKYGVGVDARQLREECYTTQRVRSESHFNFTSNMRADHEFYCSSTAPINHRVHIRHEESPSHVKSSLDMSYGKHWDEINNKRTLLLSQSFKNQSTDNHTSYTLEFNLQVPEKNLNYRTQLLHSHLRQLGSESSTHLKINYNNMIPLVAGLHWKTPSSEDLQKKWEGTFNMDTPWLYIYTTHVLSQHQHHSLQLTSELTFSKWITLRNLHLEGVFRDRGREKEARLKLYTPTATYIQVEGWGFVGKQHVKSYCSLVSLWTAPLRGEISLETLKFSHTLHMLLSSGKQNASLAAALTTVNKNLKRRQVSLKIALSEPKSRKELELNGTLEELRKDKKMYQKTAVLLFRQPFQTLPPSLVLRQTFTSDLLRGLYILESRAGLYDSREIVHTLTIGYRPPSPFVCSALFHPFSSQTIPPDSEFCVNVSSNLTLKEVQGKLRIGSKEKLNFFGQVQANPLHLQQQMIKVKANMSHQLQLLLPSSAVVEGDIRWKTENKSDFDYQTQGRLKVERNECKVSAQISGSPGKVDLYAFVKHPFKSKLPKTIEAKASADVSPSAGGGKSSVRVKADGKDRALLDAQMSHSLQQGGRSMGLRMNLSQSLLPALTDLYISTMANMTPNSVSLHGSVTHGSKVMLALFKASLNNSTGVHLVVSADLRHPFTSFSIIPSVLSLDGAFDQSHAVMEGQMRVRVMERLYSVELQHQPGEAQSRDQVSDRMARDWICVRSGVEYLCVNVSHQISPKGMREFSTQLSHSFHQLSATGVPTSNTAHVRWDHDGGRLWVTADVQVGTEYLKAGLNGGRASGSSLRWDFVCSLQHQVNSLLKRGISNSSGAKAHCQIYEEGLDTGLQIHVGDEPMVDALFAVGSKNGGVFLAASIWQQMKVLSGVVPNYLQMNCSGDGAADRLSAQCHGNIAGRPVETLLPPQMSVNISLSRSSASTDLITAVHLLNEQKGKLLLSLTCHPSRTFRASFQHSIDLLRTLGFLQQGSVMLSVSPSPMLAVNFNLDLGRCYFNGNVENPKSSNAELSRFLYAANLTSYCPALQETVLPVSVVYTGVLSLVPCQLMLTTFLKADSQELSLDLGQSCSRSPHVFGTLKHTFPALRSRGVPQTFTVEVTAPSDPQPTGVLVIKLGSCYFQVDTERDASGRTMWVWRLQSKCPMLQAQLNGSVWHDHQGSWTVKMETNLKGRRGHLTLNAQSRPDFFMEGKVHQNIPFLRGFPESSKITLRSRALEQQYKTEAFIHVDDCVVKAAGAVMLHPGLQGSVLYHNNCTVIQGFGSPDEIQASGSLAVSPAVAKAQVSAVIDGTELHSVVSLKQNKEQNEVHLLFNHTVPLLKRFGVVTNAEITLKSGRHGNQSCYYLLHCCIQKQKFTQEIKMEKTSVTTRVENQLRHSFSSLKKLGLPGNSSVQVEISSSEGNTLNLLSQFGEQKAGLKLRMKSFSSSKEMRGVMWHNLTWLRDQALPSHVQGSCSIQGPLSQLQSGVQVEVDGNKLLISGLNVSLADGRLATLLVFSPRHTIQKHFSSAMTIQFKGPLRSLSVDAQTHEWKSHLVGDVGGWGSRSASKEGRFTLKHMVLGQSSPALQVEAWGRLSASQLRCSVAVNPELTSSLALIIQGQHLPESKDLMVKVVQNIPQILIFIPSQLTLRSQLNQSRSSVGALVELNSGRRRLYMLGELAAIESGYRQTAELKHSYPQLKLLPRTVAVKTVYESRDWSYQVQHGSVFGNQEFTLFGLYSSPPTPQFGNQTIKVQITCVPRLTSLNATLEGSPVGRHDSVSLTWMRHGRQEQVSAVSWWSQSLEVNETRLELKQPFVSAAQQISIHTLSRGSMREQNSNQQTHVSWDSATPGNVSVTLNKQWRLNSSRGQACVLLSSQQMTLSTVKGCVSVGQEGNSYTQNAELSWEDRRIKQGMKYQKAARGMQSIQVNLGFVNLFPHPCHSRTLLAKIRSNLRDRLEHTVFFGLCPPEPTVSWAGTHRVNSGKELFHSQSRLSVTGHPPLCSLTLALINSSTAQRTNVSVFTESRVGNWSVELQGSALSGPVGSGLQLQAILDGKEKMWLNSTVEGKCLQTTAGLKNGMGRSESATALVCVGSTPGLVFDLQKRDGGSEPKGLASLSVETASQRVVVRASGCLDCLTALEARVQVLDTQLRNNMLERMKASLQVVREFQLQASRDGQLLQELFDQAHRQAEALLVSRDGDVMSGWKTSPLRHFLTVTLPRTLGLLQHASMLGQQELKRPLATLAGVYQDVKGQKVEALWREIVSVCREGLTEVLTGLLENPQLKPLAQAGVGALSVALDVAGQHTYQWTDSRIAAALFGVRKQLASVYRFSPRDGSVLVSLPLPPISWSRLAEVGVVELLLEQWILRPLQTLLSIRPAAELYRLKRKIMDSPFLHRAVVVADQFVLTFDGHLHALPSSCPLLLSQDISSDPSFTLVLNSDSQNFLLMEMNNSSISIQNNGQVKVDCNVGTHVSHSDGGISVRRGSNFVEVSNESGASLSCDLTLRVCSWTLNGWLHGKSTGALGTNDNEPGNDLSLPSGPQAENMESFYSAWQLSKGCTRRSAPPEPSPKSAVSPVTCGLLFSSADSPLSSCFKVVHPGQFRRACEKSSPNAACRLAWAFVLLCQQNYVPLNLPPQCARV
ncbi:uncharacterized protein ACB058_015501 isoform 2-T2 [Synchiropus picturatus]